MKVFVDLRCGHSTTMEEKKASELKLGVRSGTLIRCGLCGTDQRVVAVEGPRRLREMFRF